MAGDDCAPERCVMDEPARRGNRHRTSEHRLDGGRAETDDHRRLDLRQFGRQPRAAGFHFARARLLVNPALSSSLRRRRGPAEVLDGVGEIDGRTVEARMDERAIEQRASRTDKGMPIAILGIPRLLANEDDPGIGRPLAKYRLRRPRKQWTRLAALRLFRERAQGSPGRHRIIWRPP